RLLRRGSGRGRLGDGAGRDARGRRREGRGLRLEALVRASDGGDLVLEVLVDLLRLGGRGRAARRLGRALQRLLLRRQLAPRLLGPALLEQVVRVLQDRGRLAPLYPAVDDGIQVARLPRARDHLDAELAVAVACGVLDVIAV